MSFKFSLVVRAAHSSHGGNFSVLRLDRQPLAGFIEPIMGFDHFRMSGPTFAPHPHAGFSAVSYVFDDSAGALRSRDSLGHDLTVRPGEILWTEAGSGVIHDEFPAQSGQEVHGLQLFVNLGSRNKQLSPRVLYAEGDEFPVVEGAHGNRIRILSGKLEDVASPIAPAEPFDFFDARVRGPWTYSVETERTVMAYVLSGAVTLAAAGEQRTLREHEAIGIRAGASGGTLQLEPLAPTHLLLLSGRDPEEPVAIYGPFIMNTQAELEQAYERYRTGRMGRLAPL